MFITTRSLSRLKSAEVTPESFAPYCKCYILLWVSELGFSASLTIGHTETGPQLKSEEAGMSAARIMIVACKTGHCLHVCAVNNAIACACGLSSVHMGEPSSK